MRNLIGFPEFDNSDTHSRNTVIANVQDAVAALIRETAATGTCHTCAFAALVHCAIALLRLEGVELEEISDIVANALFYAEQETADEAREAFEGDYSAQDQEAANG